MRDKTREAFLQAGTPHFGLAYDSMAPPPAAVGEPNVNEREAWLKRCEGVRIPEDYQRFYYHWSSGFPDGSVRSEIVTRSRLLIGHGNASGADVGLSVHRTWGVPVIPGSALKGLAAQYVDVAIADEDSDRSAWRGPVWGARRVVAPARENFRYLFGTPPASDGETGGARGAVEFHDALFMPDASGRPFARDVLTVHQKPYYDEKGEQQPTDWYSPVPVGFLSVKPKTRFRLMLTGDLRWAALAREVLKRALDEWGIGGKTSAGYGKCDLI